MSYPTREAPGGVTEAILARIFPEPGALEASLPEREWYATGKKNEQGEPLWASRER
jgi:hypothetical protein